MASLASWVLIKCILLPVTVTVTLLVKLPDTPVIVTVPVLWVVILPVSSTLAILGLEL